MASIAKKFVPTIVRQSHGLQRFMLLLGFAIIAAFLFIAIFAPWLAPYNFNADRTADGVVFGTQQAPSASHWFGTTVGGTDVLSRVIYGTRTAVEVILLAVLLSGIIGVPLGLVSGYLGGWLDRILVLVMDALYAFPSLLLAIVVAIVLSGGNSSAFGGIMAAAISITVVFIPQYFRVIRNATIAVKVEPYVDSARVVGVRTPRILRKHIFSNVSQSLPVIGTLNASEAILTLAGLGFLGFGIEPSAAAEWGYDLNKAMPDASSGIWWTGVFPGLAIVLIVLGATLVGESLNDILNPLLRNRGTDTTSADEAEIAHKFEEVTGAEDAAVEVRTAPAAADPKRVVALSLNNLEVNFQTDGGQVHAVNGVTFDVAPGEVVAVVGESGSGKSVSSRAILGLLPSSAEVGGSVTLGNRELLGMSEDKLRPIRGDQVSMVFQEPSTALNPVYTVGWQIVEGLQAHTKISKKDARKRAVELLEMVGMPDSEHRVDYYPHQLSGGQKQRVVIAMAIACEPDVIIADEPTTALDVTVQAAILELLLSLRDRLGTAIVLITHNMGVVADMADRVVVMYRGNVVESAPSRELFASPKHPYTRALLDAVPHLGRENGPGLVDANELVLKVDDLVVEFPGRFGQPTFRAVDHVSLEVRKGEVLGLVGESGSGKSTIGRTAVGLQQPTSGTIDVSGNRISGLSDRELRPYRSRFGFVFQDPASSLNPRMSIGQCIAEPLHVQTEMTQKEVDAKVRSLLESVELGGSYAERFPHELSGGQRQRVSLARALSLDPDLLIADEPTSALDVSVQARVLELFTELQHRLQFACLFISHDLAVVDTLANRVAVMQDGKLVEIGPREQVLGNPQEEYTKRLIAAVPVPDPVEQRRRREERGHLLTDIS
ncbi:ABC-type glutathione transport system ATPase component/ABC-type dipeptide/oligopeptide/nickel transport system permease subunit [Aeromicrobium panaciterrae]|uniref:ABC-type glutathione transport system ATPase component/ABC-type dipeptide/oligopeptide/nickel transport system permease subunit n=1 Tax=Aeromicrobium panaciterrae TaxID=363861 RepID=A0ABU1UK14_9ACTN|nr:dipeptide ABC transporter ATP-binding protein [Aeromicrobium panaciterrae]MDR7085504.1 ABC-type glutathione transport system ATPase component/ABC-type dipeptide/oligopeptide/nickel transport system permease subunit [Aeromicrobium panaciterrae]